MSREQKETIFTKAEAQPIIKQETPTLAPPRSAIGRCGGHHLNPVYGYGKLLLPTETVVAHVLLLNRELAEKQKSLGRALTRDELDQEYTTLMDWLVAQDLCWHEQDVPAFISKEEWLQAQQRAIQRLAEGQEVL